MSETKARSGSYLVHPWLDLLTAGGGLSLLLFIPLGLCSGPERSPIAIQIAAVACYLVNYPHFAATVYRLYHTAAERKQYFFETHLLLEKLHILSST